MAEWKAQVTYNYNPSFHTYYSLLYQPVSEQNHGSLAGWADGGVPDVNDYNGGATQSFGGVVVPTTAMTEESPPHSPEDTVTGSCYQGTGLVYQSEPHTDHLLMTGPPRVAYGTGGGEERRARRLSASDSEAHTSPDSWSSVSSREGSLPQVDPTTWAEKDVNEEPVIRSPDGSGDVSSSFIEGSRSLALQGNVVSNSSVPACEAPKPDTAATTKGKVRVAFTECQMKALIQRFSVQRYLTPAEMKNLAEMTGLTYKQVKTWFQNRRMKLRRHHKDTSWVSERYAARKNSSAQEAAFSNLVSPHSPPYEGESQPHFRDIYNQHVMKAAFKKTPQNLAYYVAAVCGPAGPAGYSHWSSDPSQANAPNLPHAAGWSMPQGVGPFDFSLNANIQTAQFESKGEEPVSSTLNTSS